MTPQEKASMRNTTRMQQALMIAIPSAKLFAGILVANTWTPAETDDCAAAVTGDDNGEVVDAVVVVVVVVVVVDIVI